MKLLLLIIFSLLLAIGIGTYTGYDSGQIMVVLADWSIQTSFNFFIFIIIVLFILSHLLLRLVSYLFRLPKKFDSWQKHRTQRLSARYLSDGLMALLTNDWQKAETYLTKGIPYSRSPLVNYLAVAQIAQRTGDIKKRDAYLSKADKHDTKEKHTINLVKAELQIQQQQTEQALATLTTLHDKKSLRDQVKKMLLHTYTELKNWHAMLNLLATIKHHKMLPYEQIKAKQLEAYAGLLRQAGMAIKDQQGRPEELDDTWLNIPRKLRATTHLLEIYLAEKLKSSNASDCESLLRKALKKHWDTKLIYWYGLIEAKDIAKQLKFAEGLLLNHARDASLLLTLGRLSAKNTLFGKAKKYLQESLAINPQPETYQMLGTVLHRLGEPEIAAMHYQKGLELATTSIQNKLSTVIDTR